MSETKSGPGAESSGRRSKLPMLVRKSQNLPRKARQQVDGKKKDKWDKIDILLKPIGSLLTASVAAYLGFLASNYIERQQELAASVQLYAELMSNREAADSALRKEMFNTTLAAFLDPASGSPEDRIIKLELLAHNFHNSLDIAPLFDHVYRELNSEKTVREDLLGRLERLANQVNQQQLAALETVGARKAEAVDIWELPDNGKVLFDAVTLKLPADDTERTFALEILSVDARRRTVRCRLTTWILPSGPDLDYVFEVSIFDFPMIRNIRLPGGSRCALVVTKLSEKSAEITLAYFPGSRASLKEKPYYDEIIRQLLVASRHD